ncbi:aldose epimerase [Streptomyces sp. SID5785]|uniref:aldose 1-epimerase family protein n=1 Tax=Streptomyces sp. SID5785 TaxID=2690309 RepID=UPI001361C88F|nr:aldose 1-epimerase family protein [Streptomyces sp. SID5785]MZD03516.1 aldose epimerase [Streptomyces sp. SID5785]
MATSTPLPLSGTQHRLTAGRYAATVAGVGATLRELEYGGRPLILGFDADEPAPAAHGQLLAPWPNRLAGGSYAFGGTRHRLPLDETAPAPSALHGLTAWQTWTPEPRDGSDRVTLALDLAARPGYPFALRLVAAYRLDAEGGLTVRVSAANRSSHPAPFGLGAHPYLTFEAPLDACTVRLGADRCLHPDARMLPDGPPRPVEGTPQDLRTERELSGLVLNHAYTGLHRDDEGRARVRLRSPGGDATELWADRSFGWFQLYTADHFGRTGLAVEPMTCPPDAFNSGHDLTVLAPGERRTSAWGIRVP